MTIPVTASLLGTLTGARVSADGPGVCLRCGQLRREGHRVGVYAARCSSEARWRLQRVYCRTCCPETIQTPTLGVCEAIVTGRLGTASDSSTQQTWLVFLADACRVFADQSQTGSNE